MKKSIILILAVSFILFCSASSCEEPREANTSALDEQEHTESNQQRLLKNQPLPDIDWSMERDNLIKLKKLQNDRTVNFFMYIFIEGVAEPIGYYQVNKVSSVNSQLSNPEQIISGNRSGNDIPAGEVAVIASPSEDGSYGTNGDAIFGFTPEDICIQSNMKYICATVPLTFVKPVNRLAIINTDEAKQMLEASKKAMNK
jgi:hypothetical protein